MPLNKAEEEADLKNVVSVFLDALAGSIEECKEVLRELNALFVEFLGGDKAKYLLCSRLAADLFPVEERDAIKKATTRSEEFRLGGKKRDRETSKVSGEDKICRMCKKPFSGSWMAHRKSVCGK